MEKRGGGLVQAVHMEPCQAIGPIPPDAVLTRAQGNPYYGPTQLGYSAPPNQYNLVCPPGLYQLQVL